jgi:hypothetical protein
MRAASAVGKIRDALGRAADITLERYTTHTYGVAASGQVMAEAD